MIAVLQVTCELLALLSIPQVIIFCPCTSMNAFVMTFSLAPGVPFSQQGFMAGEEGLVILERSALPGHLVVEVPLQKSVRNAFG